MTISYDDLAPEEREAVDYSTAMSRDQLIGLMNRFDIGPAHAVGLVRALQAADVPEMVWEEASVAGDAHAALRGALEAFRKLPQEGRFVTDEHGALVVYDMHGPHPADDAGRVVVTHGRMLELLSALDFATVDQFIRHDDAAMELEAEVAGSSNRLDVSRHRLWLALLRFWRDDLGRSLRLRTNHYQGSADPSGPVIDFVIAASVNAVHQVQRTPQAVREFIRRNQKSGKL